MGSLSKVQQSIVLGSLLGDGYMRCKANAHLQVTHSLAQKDYVDWKYKELAEYVLTPPKSYRGNGNRIGYRFFTRSLPEFTVFHKRFYVNGIKVIPDKLELTPLALAVWFMDDGSRSGRSCYLNTQQFPLEDQLRLIDYLSKYFGLRPSRDRDKIYYRLRFSTRESEILTRLIKPYVLPFLRYKLLI